MLTWGHFVPIVVVFHHMTIRMMTMTAGQMGTHFCPTHPSLKRFRLQSNRYFQFGAPPRMRFFCSYFVVFDRITLIAFAIRVPILYIAPSSTIQDMRYALVLVLESFGTRGIFYLGCEL